jgi:phosphatidylglycerol lysyltransferase
MRRLLRLWGGPIVILVLLLVSLFVLHNELRQYRYHDLSRAILAIPRMDLLLSLGFTVLAYALLPGYDATALAYVGRPLPLHRVAFSSFISYGLSQTLGFPIVTATSVRYRFWSAWGLSTSEIAQAISFVAATFVLGMILLTGAVFLIEPDATVRVIGFSRPLLQLIGAILLSLVAAYTVWTAVERKPFRLLGWDFPVPSLRIAILQLLVATVDWIIAGAVLYVLLPSTPAFSFLPFLGAFLLAQFAGQISHVPGGLGVFETLMVLFLEPHVAPTEALGALIAYRAIYYLLPFAGSLFSLAVFETLTQRQRVAKAVQWGQLVLPQALSATTFIAGLILLVSGATPSAHQRQLALEPFIPLGVIELSHIAANLAGAGLVVLAWAIRRRLDAAWRLTVILIGVGIAASLLKGLDWEQALALSVVMIVVLPSHRAFYRKAAISSEPLGAAWTVAILLVTIAIIWLGFFSYREILFSNELWFRFTRDGDAPRFLRASAITIAALTVFALMRLLRHAEADPTPPTEDELRRAGSILASSSEASANLVYLADKSLMFSASGNAFLMYGVEGRSWVALGDPQGPHDEVVELAWRFREEADRHGAWTVFYEIGQRNLPLYVDLGLTILKVGETAIVPLAEFDLSGGKRKNLRRTITEVTRHNVTFCVIPPAMVAEVLPQIKCVSDAWIAEKHTREKSFSLGGFDPDYLTRFPLAVAEKDGRIVAFANILPSGDGSEACVDLMRYSPHAPPSVMEYLLIELLQWAKKEGFSRFNLGMAPLSGLQPRAVASFWNRAGALIYRRGERFYNFRGLRQYKQKFDPMWEPRYLASPGGFALPRVLTSTAALISGGLLGVVTR